MRYCVLFVLFVFLMCGVVAEAQTTRVRGRVVDADGEPLALVNVETDDCCECTSTDSRGFYMMDIDQGVAVDSVMFSLSGYEVGTARINCGCFNTVDMVLEPSGDTMSGRPCADSLIERVKRRGRVDAGGYRCKLYTKMNFGLQDFTPSRIKNQDVVDKYGFLFDNVDTSVMTNKSYIWAMVSESKARRYYDHESEPYHEVVEASRISGVNNNPQLAKFTGQLNSDIDVYDDFVSVLKVDFVSPLAEVSSDYYDYYLIDSLDVDSRKTYRVRFEPKKFVVPVFKGELWIDSESFAVCQAHLVMAEGVDMNWVNALSLETESRINEQGVWLKSSERQRVCFAVLPNDSSRLYSLLVHRAVDYSDFEDCERIMKPKSRVIVSESALLRGDNYWSTARTYGLTPSEQDVFFVADSVRAMIQARPRRNTLMSVLFGGYLKTRYLKFGPYYKLFSFNDVEDARFQVGVATTTGVSKNFKLGAYAAYGTRDERFKGGFNSVFMLMCEPLRRLTFDIKRDLVQLGQGDDALFEANIFSSVFARDQKRMNMVNGISLGYDHGWREGINSSVLLGVENVFSSDEVPFVRPDGQTVGSVDVSLLSVSTRFSWDEISYVGRYNQKHLYSKKPYFTVKLSGGVRGFLMNDYNFMRMELVGQYSLPIPPLGVSHFTLSGGKIFGKVPFLLLKLHEGNGTYFYSQTAFSCMNYYEFASDSWVSLMYEHNFRGLLIKHIPLLRRTSLRTVVTMKSVYGTISERNNGGLPNTDAVLVFPKGMSKLDKPYVEAGFGVTNIFRVFRVDAIWRLSYRDTDKYAHSQNFTLNFGVLFKF